MLKCFIGHSEDPDSVSAIAEVIGQLRANLGEAMPQAGILFAAIDFEHDLILQQVTAAFPQIELIGGTTDGEISSLLEFQQDSLTLMVFCSDTITISAGIGQKVSEDVAIAAKNAVEQAIAAHEEPVKLCISIPESLTVGGDSILDALKIALGADIPIFGGLTADQWQMKQTYQFFKSEVHSDAVPVLLFSGAVKFSHGIASGWQPIGKPGIVTKAIANIVYEIDHQPAQAFYSRYLGAMLPSLEYPLALFDRDDGDRHFMRAPIGLEDPEIGSIHFLGYVPTHSIVQITEATHDTIIAASQQSFDQAIATYPGDSPEAALFFSCAGRRRILGSRTAEEYGQIQRSLEKALPSCGFYTNGEIAPLRDQGISCFHNETFITLILGEV
jgi:hypothetical protein